MKRVWNIYELRKFIEELTGLETWNYVQDNFKTEMIVIQVHDSRDKFADNQNQKLMYLVTITYITDNEYKQYQFDEIIAEHFQVQRASAYQDNLILRHFKTELMIDFSEVD